MSGPRGPRRPVPARFAHALLVAVAVLAVTLALGRLAVPSPALFAGLLVGLVDALAVRAPLAVPERAGTAAQAAVGVTTGTLVQLSTLRALGEHWLPVVLVVLATLALSLGTGWLLGRHRDVDAVTGAFALVAGGASGLVVMARELGADQRVVAVVQYLRVLVVVLSLPLVLQLGFGVSGGSATAGTGGGPWWAGALLLAGCSLAGLRLGRLARLPAPSLLGPLLVTAVLSLSGLTDGLAVPALLEQLAYAVIGLQVGTGFTRAGLAAVARVLPAALALIAVGVAGCAGLAVALSAATGLPLLDTYLATTPGGLYAVLAAAVGSGADATFVLSVQVLRLLVMLLAAPVLARLLAGRPDPPPA
ncbi:AbrB family transcriptional regulator [Kineococcus terrestris]|uniref:AbrB family transcriptional regulator n=1 Tax=Kineococcus terrestris TaxID=2044856 RepID=UPI0034DB624E